MCYPLKRGDRDVLKHAVDRIRQRRVFPSYFGADAVVVPVPSHAPLQEGSLWPAKMIAEALVTRGLADRWTPMLKRAQPVHKAATSPAPRTVQTHLRTMRVQPELPFVDVARILVVDDVVTSGATLFAAVQHIRTCYPKIEVNAFALIRRVDEIPDRPEQCLQPCRGTVTLRPDGRPIREP